MHTEREYNRMSADDWRRACEDTLHYIGSDKYKLIVRALRYGTENARQIEIALMIAGVQGFPVDAMIERYRIQKRACQHLEHHMLIEAIKVAPKTTCVAMMDIIDNNLATLTEGHQKLLTTEQYLGRLEIKYDPQTTIFTFKDKWSK